MVTKSVPEWILNLDDEDVTFLKNFILQSGSLKQIAAIYEVSYPTVRLRLDRLIQKIKIQDHDDQDNFISLIKRLALNDQLDFETAKLLVSEYKKSRNKGEK